MKNISLIYILMYISINNSFAQGNIKLVFLDSSKDSIAFDKKLLWYALDENQHNKLLKINLNDSIKSTIVKNDSIKLNKYKLKDIDLHGGRLFIGVYKSLNEFSPYHVGIINPGFYCDLNMISINATNSDNVFLYVTGNVKNNFPKPYNLKLNINYENINEKIKFTQELNKMIEDSFSSKELFTKHHPLFLFKMQYVGFLDNDHYLDFIMKSQGYYFIFLSYKHDISKKQMYHIEKIFKDEACCDF